MTRRHLPVFHAQAAAERRPPWHWALAAALLSFVTWMPLLLAGAALVRVAIERQWGSATSLSITLPLGALALACLLTTFMLGRLASEARIAAILAGVLTMTVAAWALALTQGALSSLPQALGSLLVLLAAAASSGWAGHRLAARGRHQIP